MKVMCLSCNDSKGKRDCPALNGMICSVCCGTKRLKEIQCPDDCLYLESSSNYLAVKGISQTISNTFKSEADDIFKIPAVSIELAAPFESFLSNNFYLNSTINDDDIYSALSKIYLWQTKQSNDFVVVRDYEKIIFDEFCEIFGNSSLSDDLKSKTILRILMSIKKVSGGVFGNRNYLRFISEQFFM
ncbi:MAG: hypothetical protein RO257_05065 [Candidatus Kapabacteria bacterium]|nr:hypothetical protein [Candidatus Kapabacteria bacterium]